MVKKEDNKYLLNVVFCALSFLLAPLVALLLPGNILQLSMRAVTREQNPAWPQWESLAFLSGSATSGNQALEGKQWRERNDLNGDDRNAARLVR